MLEVSRVTEPMVDEIVRLCQGFNNPRIQPAMWKALLNYPWRRLQDPPGYVLTDSGKIVGFLGTVYSHPIIDGKSQTLCNITSFIVQPEYQNRGGALLLEVLNQENTIVTNLSSASQLQKGMRKLGFETLEDTSLLVSPLGALMSPWNFLLLRYLDTPSKISLYINEEERKILNDHAGYPCSHLLVRLKDQYCYIIYNVHNGPRYRYGYVHYASNVSFFARFAAHISARLLLKNGLLKISCDQRILRGKAIPLAKKVPLTVPRLYRPAMVSPENIPNLYSELVML